MRKCLGMVIVMASMVGCATPQTITIETSPAGAAVSINDEYIGRSPTIFEMQDASAYQRIQILAEKQSYETTLKLIKRKPNGTFPQQVFLKLDPTVAVSGMTTQMGGQQQGGTTIQGPTIVIPGMAPAPQIIPPAVTPPPAPSSQQLVPLQN